MKSIQPRKDYSLREFINKYPSHSSIQIHIDFISNEDMRLIVQNAIREKSPTELWLYNAKITSQGALILADGLYNNTSLKKLYLNDNLIQDRGVFCLARALLINNSTLEELYLARNGITSRGAQYLADMLITNRTLTTLSLYGNHIDDQGIKYLTHVLSYYNSTLEYLYLSGNKLMSDASIDYLLEMFEYNETLKKIHLFNCNFSDAAREKLQKAVRTMKSTIVLYI